MMAKYTLKPIAKRKYHRDSTMSKAEIMLIMILFHDSGYRCLKHFYQEKVCKHIRPFFPKVVSYNRFVELEKDVAIPQAYSSRRYFWVNVQVSVLLTALLYGYARTREYIFICEFGIRRIKKAQVVVYSPYVQVMAAAYPQKSNMQQALSINSL